MSSHGWKSVCHVCLQAACWKSNKWSVTCRVEADADINIDSLGNSDFPVCLTAVSTAG